ncbi:hypothetical protein GCM10007424_07680 [Flavobacterium suaedae]|uniref:RHS repeat protein n=2 Tax=Flavobacterium suaedae TaxID=1767027 RepID=A0ABQ1JIX4_9FLAO|nr:hypothetical protein GCM10007424_07680 [Flavobacterium suaedae]
MTFEEVPVDYYTGQPDISIPIYSKKLNGDMSLPIALKYNTQGVKVTSRSGWTGTGWSLEAGGSISRTVRGTADEANRNNSILTGVYNLPNDEFFSYDQLLVDDQISYSWYANGTNSHKYDSELDLYQFSILGATGRFVLVKGAYELEAKLLTKDQKVKIAITHNKTDVNGAYYKVTEITGFVITDANGYKYYFGESGAIETTTSTPYSSFVPQVGAGGGLNPDSGMRTTVHTSAWHLYKITTNNGEELVSFNYTTVNESYKELENRTEYILDNNIRDTYLSGGFEFEGGSNPNIVFNNGMLYPKSTTSGANTTVATKKLSQIVFRDDTKITFNTSGTHPEYIDSEDNRTGTILNGLSLYSASNTLWKTFAFAYTENNRLWLDKVTESTVGSQGGITEHSLDYKLEYNSKNLPEFGHGDSWGYKYVNPNNSFLYLENHLDGVLKRIVYPTGGVKDFEFEPHTYSYEGDQLLPEEETDKNPMNHINQSQSPYFYIQPSTAPTNFTSSFYIQYTQNINFNFNIIDQSYTQNPSSNIDGPDDEFDDEAEMEWHYGSWFFELEIQRYNSNTNQWEYNSATPIDQGNQSVNLAEGTYRVRIRFQINKTTTDSNIFLKTYVNFSYQNLKTGNQYNQFLVGGGLRIKEINFRENETTTESEKKLMYFYNTPYDVESTENLIGNITMLPELEPTGGVVSLPNPSDPHLISSGAVDGRSGSYSCEYFLPDQVFLKNLPSGGGNGQCSLVNVNYDIVTTQQNKQLTKGGFVSYKHVRVRETGKGYSYYNYKTPQDEPLTWSKCIYPFKDFPNIDYKRGWLLTKKVFNEQNQLLVEETNTYELREEEIAITRPLSSIACAWIKCYTNVDQYLEGTNPDIDLACLSNSIPPYNCGSTTPYFVGDQTLMAGSAPLKSKIKKEYFIDEEEVVMTQTETSYEYNPVNYQISNQSVTIEEGGATDVYKTEYQYPVGGYTNSLFTPQENSTILNMATTYHVINKPIVVATYKNDIPLQKTVKKYKIEAAQPVIKEIETLKGNITSTGEDRIVYHQYDELGNPLDVSMKDGTHICYIWGYNNTFPAVKLEGVQYSDIPSSLRDNIINATDPVNFSESALIAAQDALRTYYDQPGSTTMVTTLVYEPTRGVVTSVTDPRGDVLHYEYDNLGRLLTVKDKDNYLLSKNEYHYRTEQ